LYIIAYDIAFIKLLLDSCLDLVMAGMLRTELTSVLVLFLS